MSYCSHTPRTVKVRDKDVRCLNCRAPMLPARTTEEWLDRFHKFLYRMKPDKTTPQPEVSADA